MATTPVKMMRSTTATPAPSIMPQSALPRRQAAARHRDDHRVVARQQDVDPDDLGERDPELGGYVVQPMPPQPRIRRNRAKPHLLDPDQRSVADAPTRRSADDFVVRERTARSRWRPCPARPSRAPNSRRSTWRAPCGWCPSAAFAGSVAPMTSRYLAIAFSPSSTCTTTGPEIMKSTSSPKNGRSLCTP